MNTAMSGTPEPQTHGNGEVFQGLSVNVDGMDGVCRKCDVSLLLLGLYSLRLLSYRDLPLRLANPSFCAVCGWHSGCPPLRESTPHPMPAFLCVCLISSWSLLHSSLPLVRFPGPYCAGCGASGHEQWLGLENTCANRRQFQ